MKKFVLGILAVIVCFGLVGCGQKQETPTPTNQTVTERATESVAEVNTNDNNQGAAEEYTNVTKEDLDVLPKEELENIQENVEDINVYESGNQIVLEIEDDTTGIYYHDGEKITGYEVKVKYDSPLEAETAKAEYNDYEEDQIESLRVEGSYLIATYAPEAYEDVTLEEVKQTISLLELLKDYE